MLPVANAIDESDARSRDDGVAVIADVWPHGNTTSFTSPARSYAAPGNIHEFTLQANLRVIRSKSARPSDRCSPMPCAARRGKS